MDAVFEPLEFWLHIVAQLRSKTVIVTHMAPLNTQAEPANNAAALELPNTGVRSLLEELMSIDISDYKSVQARANVLGALAQQSVFPSLEPILPMVLNLNGKPYALTNHYPFSPLFRCLTPKNQVWCTGRQVSKSTSLAAHGVVVANSIPFFKTLFITPLYEQIRRFSNNYVRPFIDQSPVKALWSGTSTENSVLQRSFKNNSMMLFSFALLDADRVRGVSADRVCIDEVQDMDPDHVPIIQETMSYSKWGTMYFTGTPKTFDNLIYGLYKQSSQAEWFIPCHACGKWNIPSLEYDLDAMIGPSSPHISEQYPGTVCAQCRKPINPRHGRWVHRYPEKRWQFSGYHVPQIILPLHFADAEKWNTLLLKREGFGNMTQAQFYNEVMGESIDTGQKLVSETDLKNACVLPWENKKEPDPASYAKLFDYKNRILAVDWGGGGEAGVSFTAIAVLGFRHDGAIDVLWGKRLLIGGDHLQEAVECMKWSQKFKCDLVAHDYTGAGTVRETVMVQAGFNLDRVMAMRLVRSAAQDLIVFKPPTEINHRQHYSLDKTRSLLYTCQAIKLKQIRFFKYDWSSQDSPGLVADFLSLVENKAESRLGGDIYTITRNTLLSDDFAQAVNLGAAGLWHVNQAWPNFARLAGIGRLTERQIAAQNPQSDDWADDAIGNQFFGP